MSTVHWCLWFFKLPIFRKERLVDNLEYDEFGAQKFKKGVPHYKSGFPREHRICHRADVDIGGPSYVRYVHDFSAQSDTVRDPINTRLNIHFWQAGQTGRPEP